MKQIIIIIAAFLLSIGNISAQTSPELTLGEEVTVMMEDLGYELSTSQFAYISEGMRAYHYKTFYEGNDYAIIGFPEMDNVYDIDLYLYDESGELLMESSSEDGVEILEFTSYSSEEYKVVIENYDSDIEDNKYKVKFMIFWMTNYDY